MPFLPSKKTFKKRKIRNNNNPEIEFQEVLIDRLIRKKEGAESNTFETPLNNKVLIFFLVLFLSLLGFLAYQTAGLQFWRYEEFAALASRNFQRLHYERPVRGVIYDSSFNQLAFNDFSFDLVCRRLDLSRDEAEKEKIIMELAALASLDFEEVRKKIEESEDDRILLAENLDHQSLVVLGAKIDQLPGFSLEENIKRFYENGPLYAHVLGYLGRIEKKELSLSEDYSLFDFIGKAGLEKSYESILRGSKGKTIIEKDVFNEEISYKETSQPQSGKSLLLWLDSGLQEKSFQALSDSLERVGASAGVVIVMDPQSGGILSLVSLPSFDNNIFFSGIKSDQWEKIFSDPSNPFWNRCVSAVYPTGSTIKPLIAAAALEEKIIDPNRKIGCQGFLEVANPWFEDQPWIFGDWKTHGPTDMRKAIAESCNVYFYTIGGGQPGIKGLGAEKIKKYLELFGWGDFTGIDLAGERKGLIPDSQWKKQRFESETERIWLPGDTYNLSIGQGYLQITPLQVVNSFAALANNGELLEPRLVKAIVDQNKNIIEEIPAKVIHRDFIEKSSLKIVREGMRDAVLYGSSVRLNSLPVTSAAKTGTAQTSRPNFYHNWVSVFAPYENPEVVLTVMIENVPEEQVAALPVAREILEWYFSQ